MKNKDEMKSYFVRHREEFDDQQPPDLWEAIETELPQPVEVEKVVPLKRVWQVAAGVVLILGAAWIFTWSEGQNDQTVAVEKIDSESTLIQREYPELEEAGLYYQAKIDATREELGAFPLEEEDVEMIQILEDEMDALRQTLGNEADDQEVVEAMIRIYRHKLDLMRDLLKQLKKEPENGKDEDIVVVPL